MYYYNRPNLVFNFGRYYADKFDHFEYSSREVGHALGDQILSSYGASTDQTKRLTTKDRRRYGTWRPRDVGERPPGERGLTRRMRRRLWL